MAYISVWWRRQVLERLFPYRSFDSLMEGSAQSTVPQHGEPLTWKKKPEQASNRWRASVNGEYFIVNASMEVESQQDEHSAVDTAWHQSGNYFKDQDTAQLVADALRANLRYMHGDKSIDRSIYLLIKARDAVTENQES